MEHNLFYIVRVIEYVLMLCKAQKSGLNRDKRTVSQIYYSRYEEGNEIFKPKKNGTHGIVYRFIS